MWEQEYRKENGLLWLQKVFLSDTKTSFQPTEACEGIQNLEKHCYYCQERTHRYRICPRDHYEECKKELRKVPRVIMVDQLGSGSLMEVSLSLLLFSSSKESCTCSTQCLTVHFVLHESVPGFCSHVIKPRPLLEVPCSSCRVF